jgi:hypothetical protein
LVLTVAVLAVDSPFAPDAWGGAKFKVLHRFYAGKKNNGGLYGGLTLDGEGNLYGTTWGGGTNGEGTIFGLMPSGEGLWAEKVLHSFDRRTDGAEPRGTLLFHGDATLYGTTGLDGPNGDGTVFEMVYASGVWNSSVIDGYGSHAGVILDLAGNLYGTISPGKHGDGAVTELVRGVDGWRENILHSFCSRLYCTDGSVPVAGVRFDRAGNLYGTTEYGGHSSYCHGGAIGCGVVFELMSAADSSWKERVLHIFPANENDGSLPHGGLVLDKSGKLYGTTEQGGGQGCGAGTGCGTVYRLTPTAKGWKETVLYNFANAKNGAGPSSSLTFDALGNLWGTAGGGTGRCEGGCGVVFKMTPGFNGNWTYSVAHRFTGNDGAYPNASVVFDSQGNLYGTTELGGGRNSVGVVFEITP